MSKKQKPCPLCGRDMTAIETHPGRGELYCGHCDLTIGGNEAKTPEELTELMDNSKHRQLKDENEQLRELSKFHYECSEFYRDERDRLKDENAKLCDVLAELCVLVRDMLRWMPCHGPCRRCEQYKYPNGCEFERRRLELGIEVD